MVLSKSDPNIEVYVLLGQKVLFLVLWIIIWDWKRVTILEI